MKITLEVNYIVILLNFQFYLLIMKSFDQEGRFYHID